jgi:hypothetical protein
VIAWTFQAADEQAPQAMAEAEYLGAHPEVASLTIKLISQAHTAPHRPQDSASDFLSTLGA